MGLAGTCQTCGTIAPIEWFLSETDHRQVEGILVEIPREIGGLIWHYLALFKPESGKAMQIKKAARLLSEIKQLTTKGHVQYEKKVARPCPPRIWALAIEQMIERRSHLSLPMPNHNYLIKIAWDLADKADAMHEKSGPSIVRKTSAVAFVPKTMDPLNQYIQGHRDTKPTDQEMAEWKKKQMK
jgi:hypothetical protein